MIKSISFRVVLGILWLILSISLGSWWAIIVIRQSESIALLKSNSGLSTNSESIEFIEKQHRMIHSEALFFLFLISVGGLSLILLSVRDVRRNQMIKDFFATVTHEMKTPLASLRLQAESLSDMISSKKESNLIKRLITDSGRLELQMDKALYLASISRSETLFTESILLEDFLQNLKTYYDEVEFKCENSIKILADRRALESIFKNIIENALFHGEANKILINTEKINDSIRTTIQDNGKGFQGDTNKIGLLFHRHNSRSGSGVGLYLVKTLMKGMKGKVDFQNSNGFKVILNFPISQ